MKTRVTCPGTNKKGLPCNRFLAEVGVSYISVLCPACSKMHIVNLKSALSLDDLQELLNGRDII